ncbi:peptidase [Elizabethkingia anophelis]|nr:peptidase [Elizabethkingia anophelis]MDV4088328.1 peptidase [Elizabethkingia anophelis]
MSQHLWKATAKRDSFKISKGMSVEILVKNTNRKPNQKEVIDAINQKYGVNTASNAINMSLFDMVEL